MTEEQRAILSRDTGNAERNDLHRQVIDLSDANDSKLDQVRELRAQIDVLLAEVATNSARRDGVIARMQQLDDEKQRLIDYLEGAAVKVTLPS